MVISLTQLHLRVDYTHSHCRFIWDWLKSVAAFLERGLFENFPSESAAEWNSLNNIKTPMLLPTRESLKRRRSHIDGSLWNTKQRFNFESVARWQPHIGCGRLGYLNGLVHMTGIKSELYLLGILRVHRNNLLCRYPATRRQLCQPATRPHESKLHLFNTGKAYISSAHQTIMGLST
jgi:hypothetical protein